MNVIRGKVKEIVLKHDASRMVQTIVKRGRIITSFRQPRAS